MNLAELKRLAPLLNGSELPATFVQAFRGSAKFYLHALQNAEHEPEVAYLHLITAGEILANSIDYEMDVLLDEETKNLIQIIQEQTPNGNAVARQIRGKLLFVKRRFVKTITSLVDVGFFDRSESREQFAGLKAESFERTVAAAYDLRSKYVHTGIPYGRWVSLSRTEMQFGRPVVDDREFSKILAEAPTLVGLERIVRYCLLRFAEANGGYTGSPPIPISTT